MLPSLRARPLRPQPHPAALPSAVAALAAPVALLLFGSGPAFAAGASCSEGSPNVCETETTCTRWAVWDDPLEGVWIWECLESETTYRYWSSVLPEEDSGTEDDPISIVD